MKTAAFLRLVADAIDAGLPEPLEVRVASPGIPAHVHVAPQHVHAWTQHLGITPGTWEGAFQRSGPAPGTGVYVTAMSPRAVPA
ncbi:hypothetical protein [Nocardioides massiliensis]|uniref:Uncharacterized protein n=1 Tax=Nocardioides massiliensis TaxID=1325935 RepID=A0ABT9NK33_9ACTN|nr:hypothetical protein [Nocardioides massiliensis]MDP9820425.1 hypothetical protein [Nocardioides massiliensis]